MSSKVSFIIQLKDKYSAVGRKVSAVNEKMALGFAKVKTKVDKLGASMGAFGKKTAKVGAVMTAAVSLPLALMARSMVNAASDAEETANKFNQVFDEIGPKAQAGAAQFAKSFGLADSTAQRMLSGTGDLLVGFGFAGDAAFDLSKQVNVLASDLASFQNFEGGAEGASLALTKALLGETESAKSLGIVVRQNTDEFRDRLKVIQSTQRVDINQAKAIAILEIAVKQSSKSIGDVSRTWGDYANVARRAEQSNIKLKESFGKDLLPIATAFNLKLTSVAESLSALEPGSRKAILLFAGIAIALGPILLLIGGLVAAIGVIGAVPALVATAIVASIGFIIAYFDELKEKILNIKDLFFNLFAVGPLGSLIGGAINLFSSQAPSIPPLPSSSPAPLAPVSGGSSSTLDVNISAQGGAKVESTKISQKGDSFPIGVNNAGAY